MTKLILICVLFVILTVRRSTAFGFGIQHFRQSISSRRIWIVDVAAAAAWSISPQTAVAVEDPNISAIKEAKSTLQLLLDNWQRATVDCNYADVPRDLLSTEKKNELLEKASTFALFDKSVSVESCRKTNRIVRQYIGATGIGPLVGIEKKIRKALDLLIDPDRLQDFVLESESFSQALARASSFSYAAGTADFDSVNNFEKGSILDRNENSNLEQARLAIQEAASSLDRIIALIDA